MYAEDKKIDAGKYNKIGIIKAIGFALLVVAAAIIMQIGVIVVCEVFSLIFLRKSLIDDPNGSVVMSILYAIVSAAIAFVVYYFINRKPKINAPGTVMVQKPKITSLKRIGIIILFGLVVQWLMNDLLNFVYAIAGDTKLFKEYGEIISSLDGSETSFILVYTLFFAPLSEEYIFRGVIYSYARKHTPVYIANFLQAALFGLFHMNVVQGVYAFLGGLIFGYVAEHKRSMLELVLFHMIVNASGVLVVPVIYTALEKIINPLILYGIGGVLAIAVTIILLKMNLLHDDKNEVGFYENKS